MSRTRALALGLVNWKGVFYARYLLDRHVTALEGANGAGKTTVMIAAYVVLLPDMSRLRFTNLGETGATGGDKGIWGRLGDPGRPSYAVIDFALADKRRLIAGVHLERKGEPSVEPTPFIVSGLAEDVRLQDLLLIHQGDCDVVPELHELRENAARFGGRLQDFGSARDYFGALFEQGVTPLRLSTDEERNKLNEMLRTSMTGGISRALTSELRGFVLKEEGGLASTLQRMRANLEACRRTRTEVKESQRLEQEIGAIFEAGEAMFVAAFLATRERADEFTRRVEEAQDALTQARNAEETARIALEKTVAELETVDVQRGVLGKALESARTWYSTVRDALAALSALETAVDELAQADACANAAASVRAAAEAERDDRRAALRRAQEGYNSAAAGLADIQRGIEELHRRAGAYLQVTRRLHEAERCLQQDSIAAAASASLIAAARADLAAVDQDRRSAATLLADANDHRERHAQILSALRALIGHEVEIAEAYEVAAAALQHHRSRVSIAERLPTIQRDLSEARRLAGRQSQMIEKAQALGIAALGGGSAAEVVTQLLSEAELQEAKHEESERAAKSEADALDRSLGNLDQRRRMLIAREPEWREHDVRAKRLAVHLELQLTDRATLDRARARLADQLASAISVEGNLRDSHEELVAEARSLLAAGGPFAPELLRLRDELGAELAAASFDNVSLEEAGLIEARLGPLSHALVVDDVRAAARAAAGRPDGLSDVLFVPRDSDLENFAGRGVASTSQDVIVEDGIALRVSRVPSHPRLGRRAREARAAQLRELADKKANELDEARANRRRLEHLVADGEALLAGNVTWLAGDPAPEIKTVTRDIEEASAKARSLRALAVTEADSARLLRPRIAGLRSLIAEARLLEPPDYNERVRTLTDEEATAREASAEITAKSHYADLLERERGVLRHPPLTDEDIEALRLRVEDLKQRREVLDAGIDALEYVSANADALTWSEAPKRLSESQALVPALQTQLGEAEQEQVAAGEAATSAESRYDDATEAFQDADGKRRAAKESHEAAKRRFETFAVPAPTQAILDDAATDVSRIDDELRIHNERRDELLGARGARKNALDDAQKRTREADEKLLSERREADPAVKRWEALREEAGRHGLLGALIARTSTELDDVRGHVNLVREATVRRERLLGLLRTAQGGSTLLTELEVLRDTSDAAFGDAYLGLWLSVRDWLRRRLPAQVAEVDDPREALLRLRDQLAGLEERLARQEGDLRGASEDVARGIEVQIRKARGQVNRLTKNLEGVSFGSIQGIRVRLSPVEKMEQVLRALREGAAQELLFQADMPIEEALDEIFKRYGGGRTGGQRLLDYREYVHLEVEIRRKTGTDWETANPTRLSTGEAIGVGAALMMVVLTEWERDATLLRGKKAHGSLRFLFLDEANRLSHDNLGVLFDLCQALDLQLLIAAPEVARAEGNTTYRLVRRTTPDGREEVVVSGRRARAEA